MALHLNFLMDPSPLVVTGRDTAAYLSVAASTMLFYDHVLLFSEEVNLIWKSRRSIWKYIFLLNRYFVPASLLLIAYQDSLMINRGRYSTNICQGVVSFLAIAETLSSGVSTAFVAHRIWSVCGQRHCIFVTLAISYIAVYGTALALSVDSIFEFFFLHVIYVDILKECVVTARPIVVLVAYTLPVVMDVVFIAITVWNTLDRPRDASIPLSRYLLKDGAVYFLVSISSRLINVIVFSIGNLPIIMLGIIAVWAMITTTVNRMLIIGTKVAIEFDTQDTFEEILPFGQMSSPFIFSKWHSESPMSDETIFFQKHISMT